MAELGNDHKVKISMILDNKGSDVYSISPQSSLREMADEMLAKKLARLSLLIKMAY